MTAINKATDSPLETETLSSERSCVTQIQHIAKMEMPERRFCDVC